MIKTWQKELLDSLSYLKLNFDVQSNVIGTEARRIMSVLTEGGHISR